MTAERIERFREAMRGKDVETVQIPAITFRELLDAADEAGRLRADNERLREAAIRLHRSRCTEDNCVLDGNPEHAAAFAIAALEGKA